MSQFSPQLSRLNANVLAAFGDMARLIPQDGSTEIPFVGVFSPPAMDEQIVPNVVRFWVDLEHSAIPSGPVLPKMGDTVIINAVSYDILEAAVADDDMTTVLKLRRNAI